MEKISGEAEAAVDDETFGQVLRRLRGNRTLESVAHAADISISYVQKLEFDGGKPSRRVVERLEVATNAQGALIEASERIGKKSPSNAGILPSTAAMSPVSTVDNNDAFGEDATERRRLLQMAAGLGVVGPVEALRQLADLSMPIPRSVEEWELACQDHLHAIRTRPPAQVQADIHVDLGTVVRQVQQTAAQFGVDHAQTRGLYRALGALSTLHANVLTRLGDHGAAIRWWRTARHAADASGDLYLQLGVRSTEAGHGIEGGQRDPATVLRMLDSAQPLIDQAPNSHGAVLIDYTRSKALAMVGQHDEARTTLEQISERLATGQLPVSIVPGYWRTGQLPYAKVWVYSATGDEDRATESLELVLTSHPDYQNRAMARLLTARCSMVHGGVDEGLRTAADVLDGLPGMHRTASVRQAGRMVLQAVPLEQRDRPAARDVRSLLAIEA